MGEDHVESWCKARLHEPGTPGGGNASSGIAVGVTRFIIKDALANGGEQVWPLDAGNWRRVVALLRSRAASSRSADEPADLLYVVQQYIDRPLLWPLSAPAPGGSGGRKFHWRIFGLLRGDMSAYLFKRGFAHVANEPWRHLYGQSPRRCNSCATAPRMSPTLRVMPAHRAPEHGRGRLPGGGSGRLGCAVRAGGAHLQRGAQPASGGGGGRRGGRLGCRRCRGWRGLREVPRGARSASTVPAQLAPAQAHVIGLPHLEPTSPHSRGGRTERFRPISLSSTPRRGSRPVSRCAHRTHSLAYAPLYASCMPPAAGGLWRSGPCPVCGLP